MIINQNEGIGRREVTNNDIEEGNEKTNDDDLIGIDIDPNVSPKQHRSNRSRDRAKLRARISRPTQFKRERGTSGSLQLVSVRLKEAGNTYLRHMNEMERSRFAVILINSILRFQCIDMIAY